MPNLIQEMIIDKEIIMNKKEFGFNSFKHHKKFDCLEIKLIGNTNFYHIQFSD